MQKPEEELELGLALAAFLLPGSGKPLCQLELAYCQGLLAGSYTWDWAFLVSYFVLFLFFYFFVLKTESCVSQAI